LKQIDAGDLNLAMDEMVNMIEYTLDETRSSLHEE
jgi:hypothetical protein